MPFYNPAIQLLKFNSNFYFYLINYIFICLPTNFQMVGCLPPNLAFNRLFMDSQRLFVLWGKCPMHSFSFSFPQYFRMYETNRKSLPFKKSSWSLILFFKISTPSSNLFGGAKARQHAKSKISLSTPFKPWPFQYLLILLKNKIKIKYNFYRCLMIIVQVKKNFTFVV